MPSSKFICPNCNSKYERGSAEINPIPPNIITEMVICESCKSHIPSHIAYRWDKITISEAREGELWDIIEKQPVLVVRVNI